MLSIEMCILDISVNILPCRPVLTYMFPLRTADYERNKSLPHSDKYCIYRASRNNTSVATSYELRTDNICVYIHKK